VRVGQGERERGVCARECEGEERETRERVCVV